VKVRAFWDALAPCSLVGVDRRFRGAYCLHHQGALMTAVSHKTLTFIPLSLRFNTICSSYKLRTTLLSSSALSWPTLISVDEAQVSVARSVTHKCSPPQTLTDWSVKKPATSPVMPLCTLALCLVRGVASPANHSWQGTIFIQASSQ
jgi:hypothetical protein